MRRKLLIGAASFLGLILIVAILVFWYIRSGRLDLYVQSRIIEALAEFGIRAEIGKTHLSLSGYTVTLDDIKLYAGDAREPFGKVDNMTVQFSVLSYLKQRINITDVRVNHPQVWIGFDEQGRFNLAALHKPVSKEEAKEDAVIFLSSYVQLDNGEFYYNDIPRQLSAEVKDFTARFTPKTPEALENKINHALAVTFNQASLTHEGRAIQNINSTIEADVTDQNANVTKFELNSDLGRATATARIDSFSPFKYDTKDLHVDASLAEIGRVFMPDANASGNVAITAAVNGTDTDYQAKATIQSSEVTAKGFTVTGLNVTTDVKGSGKKYNATAEFQSGGVSGRDLSISAIRLKDVKVTGEGTDFDLKDALAVGSIKAKRVTISNVSGSLAADPDHFGLRSFSAAVLGGNITGSASIAIDGGSSEVEADFRSIDLNQAAELAAARDVKIVGKANGSARLAFPGTNFEAATGKINATFDAAISRPEATEGATAKGAVDLTATGRGLNVDRAFVESAKSKLTAAGSVGWNGALSLAVNFQSDDMAEVRRVIESFGFIPENIKEDYPVFVSGRGSFVGRASGRLSSPTVSGHLEVESIETKSDIVTGTPGERLGEFKGDITYSPSRVVVENASLVRSADSFINFDLRVPLPVHDNVALKATIQNYDLAALVKVKYPTGVFGVMPNQGIINGTIDVTGLPGPRTIEGTAKLSLSAGEFIVPGEEEGKEKRVSVPEFTGDITLANSIVSVQNLRMQVGDSSIAGQGSFNLDTNAYSISAQGRNIDLAALADAASREGESPISITGRADIDVTGQGVWRSKDDWEGLGLNATIQGHNVIMNGRELGDAKLVATTQDGTLRVEATGNLLDQTRTLAATINLRERDWPVNASVEFTDTDIGPYLGLVSPDLAGISGRATGRITLSGPLNPPGEGFTTDRLTATAVITHLELGGNISEQKRYTITNQGDIEISASPNAITLKPVTFVGEGTSVTLEGTISNNGANSKLSISGALDLRFLSSFSQTVFTTGRAEVEATIIGSLKSPQLRGVVNLKDIGVRVVDVPLSIARGNGQIRFTANQALLENFVAAAPGGGRITIEGGAALAGLVPDRWRLEINADQVGVEYPRDTQTVVDAHLALQGNRRIQVLSGEVEVRRASYTRDITLEELLTTGGPFGSEFLDVGPGGAGGPGGLPTSLDIRIVADNTLAVKNNLADAVGSAYLTLRGPVEEPIVSGRIQLTRGTLEFRNGRFELTRGLITLTGRRRAEPILDIQTEADISGYHIEVGFTGALSKLETTVKSDPPLPEPDIISLVLTGSVSGDSSTQASVTQTGLGLAQSILSASLSEQLTRGTQRLFGLSRFSIDPLLVGRGSDPTARITVGQRVTKDLTVTYSQNLTSGPSGIDRVVLVEYRISNRFSVVGIRNERGELGFDVRLRKRF